MSHKRRVGVLGFGHVGQHLINAIRQSSDHELAFVWNRTSSTLEGKVEPHLILDNLLKFKDKKPDLIIEVAHPSVVQNFGALFLAEADLMVGSPTAFAKPGTAAELIAAAKQHGCYVPSGALWGGEDIQKMADRGTLQALRVTMTKHPSSFRLESPLKEKNDAVSEERVVLYDGPVLDLCPLAPNNVNTMAAAAIAAHNLGFEKVQGCLVSDPAMRDWHVVEIETWGPGDREQGTAFYVHTTRKNPAKIGHVTGNATYASFLSSMLRARDKGAGVHLC